MGWLARSHGLQTNSLTAIELVTADGELVRTDARPRPRAVLGAARRRRELRHRHRARVPPLPAARDLRRLHDVGLDARPSACCTAYAAWAVDAPDHVTTSFRIMQLPPLPEIPEPLRGRSIVIDRRRRPGRPGRARAAARARARDRHVRDDPRARARAPAPGPRGADALRRRHRADRRRCRPRPPSRRCWPSPAPAPARRWTIVELRQVGGALARATPGHGAVAGVEGQFVLFTCGLALDADMAALKLGHMASASRPRWRRGCGAGHYLNFAEERGRRVALVRRRHAGRACGAVKDRVDPDERDPREPRHLDSAPMGRIYDSIDDQLRGWIATPADVLRGHRPVGRRRAHQRLAEGADRLAAGDRRAHRRLPGHRRQRRGDDRPPARERPHRRDVLRLRGPAADPAPARPTARSCCPATRASTSCWRWASTSPRRPRRGARSSSSHVTRVADSCGYGVPLMGYEGERPHMDLSTAKRLRVEGPDAMRDYEAKHNRVVHRRAARRCREHHRASTRSCSREDADAHRAPSCATCSSCDVGRRRRRLADLRAAARPSSPPTRASTGGHYELYLMCDDLEATVAELEAKGVEFTAPVSEQSWGRLTAIAGPRRRRARALRAQSPRRDRASRRPAPWTAYSMPAPTCARSTVAATCLAPGCGGRVGPRLPARMRHAERDRSRESS